jgi:hypothetical protein
MIKKFPYWIWVVWACTAWAIALLVAWKLNTHDRLHNVILLGFGFGLGTLATSILCKLRK